MRDPSLRWGCEICWVPGWSLGEARLNIGMGGPNVPGIFLCGVAPLSARFMLHETVLYTSLNQSWQTLHPQGESDISAALWMRVALRINILCATKGQCKQLKDSIIFRLCSRHSIKLYHNFNWRVWAYKCIKETVFLKSSPNWKSTILNLILIQYENDWIHKSVILNFCLKLLSIVQAQNFKNVTTFRHFHETEMWH